MSAASPVFDLPPEMGLMSMRAFLGNVIPDKILW